jgi:peptidyl-tRNA hydrolase, PTH2 family
MSKQDELVQYYLVNADLGMSIGKTAAQVAHASMLLALRDQQKEKFSQWYYSIMRKVILAGREIDLDVYIQMSNWLDGVIPIIDKGLTEIPENSLTVIVFPILTRREAMKLGLGRFSVL